MLSMLRSPLRRTSRITVPAFEHTADLILRNFPSMMVPFKFGTKGSLHVASREFLSALSKGPKEAKLANGVEVTSEDYQAQKGPYTASLP